MEQLLKSFLNLVIDWFRGLVEPGKKEKPWQVIETIVSDDGLSLLRRIERQTPGRVATWVLSHEGATSYLVVTLDNLRLSGLIESISPEAENKLFFTHLISIQWIATLVKGKKVLSLRHTWVADLQGSTPDPNATANTIVRFLMKNTLNIESNPPSFPWQKRINDYPWKDSLDFYSRRILGTTHDPRITRVPYPKK